MAVWFSWGAVRGVCSRVWLGRGYELWAGLTLGGELVSREGF